MVLYRLIYRPGNKAIMTKITLTVNNEPVSRDIEARTLLVELIREGMGLTGTHIGCDTSQCGACVVHMEMPLTPEKVWRAIRDKGAFDPEGHMSDVL